jgi:hypothetical protein
MRDELHILSLLIRQACIKSSSWGVRMMSSVVLTRGAERSWSIRPPAGRSLPVSVGHPTPRRGRRRRDERPAGTISPAASWPCRGRRCAQRRSRMPDGHRRRRRAASWTAASTTALSMQRRTPIRDGHGSGRSRRRFRRLATHRPLTTKSNRVRKTTRRICALLHRHRHIRLMGPAPPCWLVTTRCFAVFRVSRIVLLPVAASRWFSLLTAASGQPQTPLDHMFAGVRGDPSHSMQVIEGCAGLAGAEPHA